MSYVLDQIRQIDAQLDRLQLQVLPSSQDQNGTDHAATYATEGDEAHGSTSDQVRTSTSSACNAEDSDPAKAKRSLKLRAAIHGLSPGLASDSRALLSGREIGALLNILSEGSDNASTETSATEPSLPELEWLLVSKATMQVYGLVIDSILSSTQRLADDMWYWDEVLSSRAGIALYSVQTSPLRLYAWGSTVWDEAKRRAQRPSLGGLRSAGQEAQETVQQSWREFYGLVRQVVKERSVKEINKQVLSPVMALKAGVREKQKVLKKVRLRNANALGVLLGEGLANESLHGHGLASPSPEGQTQHKWKTSVARNVALMEAVLAKVNDLDTPVDRFDTAIAELTDEDSLFSCYVFDHAGDEGPVSVQPYAVAERLARVLTLALPQYADSTQELIEKHGRPSRFVRYWLPITVGLLSSSTILSILVNRKEELLQWVRDLGATILDFWTNWVLEPTRKVIQTIRHDEGSAMSIVSKRSLDGDRDSLERMVVDFAVDNQVDSSGNKVKLSDIAIEEIRSKVREGDLTPVLKAYEKDMSSPIIGTIRGNLVRALLIQVQKTKVDVAIAMSGIDALLKSQELVFGFVGLTPGILVTYFAARSIKMSLSEKHSFRGQQRQGILLRQLRKIDRILVDAQPTDFGELHYRDQGLLLCEVHALRTEAGKVMPRETFREFGEEAALLCDVRVGVERQRKVAERMRWGYGRWLR